MYPGRPTVDDKLQPLHQACLEQDLAKVKSLVSVGYSVTKPNEAGLTPLDIAIRDPRYQNTAIARILMKAAIAEQASKNTNYDFNALDRTGRTLLHYAIETRDAALVKQLIAVGVDVNKKSSTGTHSTISPLSICLSHFARENGSYSYSSFRAKGTMKEIAVDLINAGANLKELKPGQPNLSWASYIAITVPLSDLPGLNDNAKKLLENIRDVCLLGHRTHSKGIMRYKGHRVKLEGLSLGTAAHAMTDSFVNFVKNQRQEFDICIESLQSLQSDLGIQEIASNPKKMTKKIIDLILESLQKTQLPLTESQASEYLTRQELLPIPLLTSTSKSGNHAQDYLIYDHLCLRSNFGATVDPSGTPPGITVYQIGDLEAFKRNLPQLVNSSIQPVDDSYLLNEFVKQCKLRKRDFLEPTNSVPKQTVGNCCWISALGLLKSIICLAIYKTFVEKIEDRYEMHPFYNKQYWELCWDVSKGIAEVLIEAFVKFDKEIALESLADRRIDLDLIPESSENLDQWAAKDKPLNIKISAEKYEAVLNLILSDKKRALELKNIFDDLKERKEIESAQRALVSNELGALDIVSEANGPGYRIIFETLEQYEASNEIINDAMKQRMLPKKSGPESTLLGFSMQRAEQDKLKDKKTDTKLEKKEKPKK